MQRVFRCFCIVLATVSLGVSLSLDHNTNVQPKCIYFLTPKNVHLLDCSSHRLLIDSTLSRVVLPELKKPSLADLRNNKLENLWNVEAPGTTSLDLSENSLRVVRLSLNALKNLSLANNLLSNLEESAFKQCHSLELLDLSNNYFETIPKHAFGESVQTLIMQHNNIRYIQTEDVPEHLHHFDASFNEIEDIDFGSLPNLRILNLRNNQIKYLQTKNIMNLKNLEILDVSSNQITKIDQQLFSFMSLLYSINLSNNKLINQKKLDISPSVEIFNISKNHLENLSIIPHKNNFEILDCSYNNIINIDNELINMLDNLKELNLSHNKLKNINLSSKLGRFLVKLDLSWNQLPSIPESLTPTNLPELIEISLDGNLITKLSFVEKGFTKLRQLSVSYLNELMEIEANTFTNLIIQEHKRKTGSKFNECEDSLYLICSNNPKLNMIDSQAFGNLNLCKLDLSKNSLSEIPENLTTWESVPWVNLQYNPLDCSCSMQWLIDRMVTVVYLHNQALMNELRCLRPSSVKGKRLVHFFRWDTKVLCDEPSSRSILRLPETEIESSQLLEASTSFYIIIAACTIVLIFLVGLGLFYYRRNAQRKRNLNRRF